ncbi:hypothetical protein [Marivita sp.]|uniref:hypothetical protein n=1 Tax=Marivita sp. TaxID=2003365 RepID=UPI003F6EDA77
MNASDTTVVSMAGVAPGTPVAAAVEGRAKIFEMTQAAEDAVLRPREAGAWPHTLRAALAARIATRNGEHDLARRFVANAGVHAELSDPKVSGTDAPMRAVLAFMDRVAADTRNATAQDVSTLQAAGVSDADIVRLAELNAFLAYQIRVIAGLRLMKGVSA